MFAIVLNKDFQKTWPTPSPTLEILAWFYRNSLAPQLNCTEKTMDWEWGSFDECVPKDTDSIYFDLGKNGDKVSYADMAVLVLREEKSEMVEQVN